MISIIIPTLEEERIIGRTLKHLTENLTMTDYEIIVTDGGSTDRTVEIARGFTSNIVIETDLRKRNIARGRNLGAAIAKGTHLVFLDADVTLQNPDAFFREMQRFFEHNEGLVAATVKLRVLPEHETFADRLCFGLVNLAHAISNFFRRGSASGEFQMITAESFRRVGGYGEHLAVTEDIDLFSRLSKIGRTKIHLSLTAYHTGRRAHAVGWPKLLATWWINALWVPLFGKPFHAHWKVIRGA